MSELDKYVKTNLLTDTLKIITTPQQQLDGQENIGWFNRILPVPCDPETKERTDSKFDDLYLYTHAEKMFEILAG